MRKLLIFSIVLFLFLSFALIVSAEKNQSMTTSTEDIGIELNLKKEYYEKDKIVKIKSDLENIVDIQLVNNTDTCFQKCYAILRLRFYRNFKIPKGVEKVNLVDKSFEKKDFKWKFLYGKLKDYKFQILVNESYNVSVPIYGNCTGYFELPNATNYSGLTCKDLNGWQYNSTHCAYNYNCIVDYKNETKEREVWKDFDYFGFKFEKNKDYYIKVVGEKEINYVSGKGYVNNVEWIPSFFGFEIKEWAWWNTSWIYRRPINVTETVGKSRTLQPLEINITGLDGKISDCWKEIRMTQGSPENQEPTSETEIGVKVLDGDNSTWCHVVTQFNISANSWRILYVYYGNPNAVEPSYSNFINNYKTTYPDKDNDINRHGANYVLHLSLFNGTHYHYYASRTYGGSAPSYSGGSDVTVTRIWSHNYNYDEYEITSKAPINSITSGGTTQSEFHYIYGNRVMVNGKWNGPTTYTHQSGLERISWFAFGTTSASSTWSYYWDGTWTNYNSNTYGWIVHDKQANPSSSHTTGAKYVGGADGQFYKLALEHFKKPTYSIGAEETANQPPSVDTPKTYDENLRQRNRPYYNTSSCIFPGLTYSFSNLEYAFDNDYNDTTTYAESYLSGSAGSAGFSTVEYGFNLIKPQDVTVYYTINTSVTGDTATPRFYVSVYNFSASQWLNLLTLEGDNAVETYSNSISSDCVNASGTLKLRFMINFEGGVSADTSAWFRIFDTYINSSNFEAGEKIIIRVNVTDENGTEDIDKVLIEIIDNSSVVQVSNESMVDLLSWYSDYSDWQYRRNITIAEQSGNTLTDYQVAINITYDSDMQSDFDDLRFTYKKYKSPVKLTIDNTNNANTLTDYQIYFEFPKSIFQDISNDCRDLRFHPNASVTDWNSTTYPYWVEECGNTLKVWIKIDSIPASSTKDIYMYFGNSDATSLSNGYGVFELYDDFDDGTVNTTIWTVTGSVTESDGMIQITDLNSNYITTVNEFSENILIRGRAKTSWYAWGAPLVWGNDSWYVAEGSYFGALSDTQTNNNFTLYDGSRHYGTVAISLDTWYNIQHKIYNGNWSMWNCSDNFTLCDYADVSISYPYTSGKITLQGTQDGTAYWDYIYVAKYADPEPTVYISEQQDGDEEIEIPYWIEDKVDGSWAYVWVKVPEIPANNNATIYMYYGNPLATSESNNISVFDYFTDFDSDDGNWTLYNADASSGYYDGYFYLKGTGAGDAHYTYDATQYLNENVRIISSINETGNSGRQLVIDDGLNTQLYGTMIAVNGTHLILLNRDGGWSEINSTTYSYTDGIWIVLDFGCHYNGTGYVCKAQVRGDGTVLLGYDGLTGSGGYVGLRIGQAGEMWYDWFAIAKYADPEPTYSIGEEESNELANTYEYNYTLPTDAVRGTWTINVYANDTQNAWGYNTTTFGVIMDTTPPTITFVSQTPSNLNESSIEPVTIIVNITDESGINLSKVAFFTGVNHTLTQDFYHYNWSWRYPANDLQPDMRRADYRNMSYWFENVVFKESPDDIWTFAGYDNSTIQFNVIDNTSTYTTINVTFFSAQMLFPQIFPFDKMYLTAENKTGQYVELHKNNWMKIKFYPSSFYNYTTENYTIYIDLNVDPNFTPNTKPLEIYFCNSSYTTGDPLDSDYCVYVEDIDATDTRNITINQSSYIQNIFYISDGYIDGVKVTDEAYLVLRTTVPEAKAFRLYYADDEISQYINFTDFNHAWVSTDDGDTWNLVYYTPDFYLISTQAERDKIMYYVYACDNLDNCANSSMQYDSLDPVNHAPAEPLITAPTENENVTGLYNITWLTIGDPDFDTYNASVYLCNPDGSINTTLANNNITGDNTQYEYYYEVDFSAFPSGKYRINVTLCDIHGLCSSSLTAYNFSIYHIYNKTIEQPSGIYAVISRTGNLERVATLINTLTITLARIGNIIRELPKTISVTHLIKIRIGPYLPSLIVNIQAEIYKQIQIIREVIKDITTILQISRISNLAREVFQNVLVSIQAYKVIDVFREVSQNILISIQLFRVHINIIRDVLEGVILNIQISRIVSVSREVSQIIATTILGIRKVVAERLATVLPTISLIIYRQVTFYKTLIQNVISVPSLKVIRIPYISQIVTITEQISRQVYITRTIVVESIITIALKVISPVRHFFELISPPYTLFSWATEYENLVLIVITIMTITVLSTVYIWRHRKELFHRPEERY